MNKFKILDELHHYKKIVAELENELQQIEEKDRASSNVQPVKKKLVIKFWKAEKALAMQIREQEGLPAEKKYDGVIFITSSPELYSQDVYLRGTEKKYDLCICHLDFDSNQDRDEYLDKITKAITDELFSSGAAELKIGEMCEVSDYSNGYWIRKKLVAILPDNYNMFIAASADDEHDWLGYKYARPICKRTEPKVEKCGELITYTWEEDEE